MTTFDGMLFSFSFLWLYNVYFVFWHSNLLNIFYFRISSIFEILETIEKREVAGKIRDTVQPLFNIEDVGGEPFAGKTLPSALGRRKPHPLGLPGRKIGSSS